MHFLQEVINAVANQPTSTWTTLGSYLAGSTLVASLVQVLKHKLNIADAKKVLVAFTGLVSFLLAFTNLILQNSSAISGLNAVPWLGHVTLLLLGGATVAHRFLVSPAYYKLATKLQKAEQFLSAVQTQMAQAKTTTAAAKPADPAQSLPEEANLSQFQV